jgi:hypothetical protein
MRGGTCCRRKSSQRGLEFGYGQVLLSTSSSYNILVIRASNKSDLYTKQPQVYNIYRIDYKNPRSLHSSRLYFGECR